VSFGDLKWLCCNDCRIKLYCRESGRLEVSDLSKVFVDASVIFVRAAADRMASATVCHQCGHREDRTGGNDPAGSVAIEGSAPASEQLLHLISTSIHIPLGVLDIPQGVYGTLCAYHPPDSGKVVR